MRASGTLRSVMSRVSSQTDLVDAYRALLSQHARITCAMDRELGEHGLGMSEFEVLERLYGGGCCQKRRVQELSDAVHLSQSALSRVIGRLEKDGLVFRAMCAEDRRGIFVELTDEGRARYEAAKPAHRAVLERILADGADGESC